MATTYEEEEKFVHKAMIEGGREVKTWSAPPALKQPSDKFHFQQDMGMRSKEVWCVYKMKLKKHNGAQETSLPFLIDIVPKLQP